MYHCTNTALSFTRTTQHPDGPRTKYPQWYGTSCICHQFHKYALMERTSFSYSTPLRISFSHWKALTELSCHAHRAKHLQQMPSTMKLGTIATEVSHSTDGRGGGQHETACKKKDRSHKMERSTGGLNQFQSVFSDRTSKQANIMWLHTVQPCGQRLGHMTVTLAALPCMLKEWTSTTDN